MYVCHTHSDLWGSDRWFGNRYTNFAPRFNGRYLSSNVNITIVNEQGKVQSVPVGSKRPSHRCTKKNISLKALRRPFCKIQDEEVCLPLLSWSFSSIPDKSLPLAFSTISLGTTRIPLFKRWRIWSRKLGYGLHFLFELGGSQLIHLCHLVHWCYQSRAWHFLAHWVSLNLSVCIAFWRTHVVGSAICLLPMTIVRKHWCPCVFTASDDVLNL